MLLSRNELVIAFRILFFLFPFPTYLLSGVQCVNRPFAHDQYWKQSCVSNMNDKRSCQFSRHAQISPFDTGEHFLPSSTCTSGACIPPTCIRSSVRAAAPCVIRVMDLCVCVCVCVWSVYTLGLMCVCSLCDWSILHHVAIVLRPLCLGPW